MQGAKNGTMDQEETEGAKWDDGQGRQDIGYGR